MIDVSTVQPEAQPAPYPPGVAWFDRLLRRDSRPLASGTRADAWGQGTSVGGRWQDPASGMGGAADRTQRTEFVPGYPVDRAMADALLQFQPQARRIAAQEAEDATREGYDLVQMDAGTADAIEQACEGGDTGEGLGLLGCLAEARTWARAYGGGAMVALVDDGRPYHEPIDRANIRRVRGLLSATRYDLPVVQWGSDPHEARTFGRPRVYQLNLQRGGGVGQTFRVHADRVIRLRGVPLPRHLSLQRQGWDGSVYDLVFSALRGYGVTLANVHEAVGLLNQGVLTSPALQAGLETTEGMAVFQARLQALHAGMGAYNEAALGGGETYEIHNRSLAGLDAAIKAAVDALVAAADGMPRLVLLGEVTAGFSNASDGELRTWYGVCASRQPRIYTPPVRRVIDLVQLSHEGPTGGRLLPYGVDWRPIWALTETEQAARDLSRAQRRSVDIACLAASPKEVRRGDPSLIELYGPLDQEPSPDLPGSEPVDPDAPLADAPDDPTDPEGVVSLVAAPPSRKPIPTDLLSPADAGLMAGLTSQKIRSMMRRGVLEYWDFDGQWRCSAADLAALGSSHHAI